MLIPVKWLKEYVDFDIETKDLADKLTMSGSHVDSIEATDKGVNKVVVGRIEKIVKHPDADKLVITTINVGNENLQIVTGATNINEGDYVPVALVGAKLPGGMKIKKGKLRGVESHGMLCSASELGISENLILKELKDGIYILDKEYPLGEDIKETLELKDEIIDFEITPNRPDCLSIVGMARETAATLNKEFKYPEIKIEEEEGNINEYVNGVEVKDNDLCKRYYGKVIKDVKVGPSPIWLRRKLSKAGIRPINNIVDITNYVMIELGQPLHAFDLENISGREIIVRRAKEDEGITTLDDIKRTLKASDLVICDAEGPVAIAGVMGGLNSEVTNDTKEIFIESANFNGRSVRLTSRSLGLRTDASSRFEKDLDPNIAKEACNRVCQLVEMIGAGKVVGGHIDIYEENPEERTITLRPSRVNNLLDVNIDKENMVSILNSLNISSVIKDDKIIAKIPSFRQDIEMEADLIEEIGRIYGFDNVKSKPLVGTLSKGEKSTIRLIEDKVKEVLKGLGLNELLTYSFVSPKVFDKINLPSDSLKRQYVELINPLGEDYSVMRTTLIPNMMEVLTRNYNYGVERALAFEIGNIFRPTSIPVTSLPYENKTLCIGMYGDVDYYNIKGVIDSLLNNFGVKGFEYVREENHHTFHPGRTANIIKENHVLGTIGEIHPDVLENYGMKERVYIAEVDVELIAFLSNLNKKYKELPKYPAISRDIALVLDKEVLVKDIERIIWENGGKLVEDVKLFDIYTGDQIPAGKKSVAYSIVYRSLEKTLTDKEILEVHNIILEKLQNSLKASLRS